MQVKKGGWQPQQAQGDFVAVNPVVLLGQRHGLVVEQTGVGHLDGGFQAVVVGALLLELEDIQALRQQGLAADILRLSLAGDLLGVFRHHFRAVDDVDYKLFHMGFLSLGRFWGLLTP